jgi:hypothetical protein
MMFDFFHSTAGVVRAINQKYATPHIKMTRMVRLSLGVLRFYLLFLVGIMVYKFITLLH